MTSKRQTARHQDRTGPCSRSGTRPMGPGWRRTMSESRRAATKRQRRAADVAVAVLLWGGILAAVVGAVAQLNESGLGYVRLGVPPRLVRRPSHRRYRSCAEGRGAHREWGFGLYIGWRRPTPNEKLPWQKLG